MAACLLSASVLLIAGCGDGAGSADGQRPTVVASTSILGDLVANVVGDDVDVEVVVPAGADPHDFQPSAQQVARLREADALVVNGAGFEAGLEDVIASAREDGVPTFVAMDVVDPIVAAHGPEPAEDHDEAADDHGHEGADPHFFADPVRAGEVVRALGPFLGRTLEGHDEAAVARAADDYADQLQGRLHEEVQGILAGIAEERRVLVTNHDVLAYFAARYDFEVVGAVIPTTSTGDAGSAGELARLAARVREVGAPAIFVDASASADLARTLADEVGGVAVVELHTESLGEEGSGADTYVGMVRTNARRIAEALGPAGS